jgi:hypothetical protein
LNDGARVRVLDQVSLQLSVLVIGEKIQSLPGEDRGLKKFHVPLTRGYAAGVALSSGDHSFSWLLKLWSLLHKSCDVIPAEAHWR